MLLAFDGARSQQPSRVAQGLALATEPLALRHGILRQRVARRHAHGGHREAFEPRVDRVVLAQKLS
eukprot:scaffold15046_cov72-Phaeocystis_antarctica.AAC.3